MNFNSVEPFTHHTDVRVSELLIATPDVCDPLVHASMHKVLRLLRDQHRMEATFVGVMVSGRPVRRIDAPALPSQFGADAEPVEFAFYRQTGKVPSNAECYLSAPVVLNDGGVYGTLYSFCFSPDEGLQERELNTLALTAQLAARLIDSQRPAVPA
ncbi:MAG: hypothetical protein EOP76_08560 [Variovorax sp.]|nr:MAG: hypothetical protein EOP76_08560 [Variovorax sp.]